MMTTMMASAIGGGLMICAGIVAMATLSHCPRRWRVWPALLLAFGALYASDRVLEVFFDGGYLSSARAVVIIGAMAAALGTISVMSWMIQAACPACALSKSKGVTGKLALGTTSMASQSMRKSAQR